MVVQTQEMQNRLQPRQKPREAVNGKGDDRREYLLISILYLLQYLSQARCHKVPYRN